MHGERELLVQAIRDAPVGGGGRGEHGREAALLQRPGSGERGRQPPEDLVLGLGVVVAMRGEVVDGEEPLVSGRRRGAPVVGAEAHRLVRELDGVDPPVLVERAMERVVAQVGWDA